MKVLDLTQWKTELDCANVQWQGSRSSWHASLMVSLDWLETVIECTNGIKIGGLKSWTPMFMGVLDDRSTHSSAGCAPSLLCCGNWWWSCWGMKLTTHIHLVPMLQISEVIPFSIHSFMACTGTASPFMLHYWFFCYVLPCGCAVLSTINTEHHIYLNVRWSCTLDGPLFTVSIFQEVTDPKHI
jgi:hypothetical protein